MNNTDIKIGRRIREMRLIRGISQAELAKKSGISFQNMQLYETGKNRVTAEKLFELAKILSVDISYFFTDDNLNGKIFNYGNIGNWEITKLVREYKNIKNEELRNVIRLLVKAIARKYSTISQ